MNTAAYVAPDHLFATSHTPVTWFGRTRRAGHSAKRGLSPTVYRVTDHLHEVRSVQMLGDQIATTVSAWLAELGANSPLVADLVQAR